MKHHLWLATVTIWVLSASACAQTRLTYPDLVARLTDLEQLAVRPAVSLAGDQTDPNAPQLLERCAQWSSYDRKSTFDVATGKYVAWDANGDGNGIIRREAAPPGFYPEGNTARQVEVLAEMAGPGCIWRIWSATPGKGRVAIYLDGAEKPAVDLPFTGYFDHKNVPFTRPALVHTTAGNGWNSYVPIPYQKSCKIVAEKGWGQYYHFTYTTFAPGTVVPTFQRELSETDNKALDEAERILGNCGPDAPYSSAVPVAAGADQKPTIGEVSVGAGQTLRLAELTGPKAITALRLQVDLPAAPAQRDVLREMVLKITWDDESEPAIWCPVGDFFGTAPGLNKYRSLPLGVTDDGWMYAHWYMPFAKKAVVEITNDGTQAHQVRFALTQAPLRKPIDQLMRFHAKWHRDALLPADPDRAIDWTMLKTQGTGRYVGVMLHIWNPRGNWWGEGDEKFFVDGEKFPSTFGTGSEDYFGYAWSSAKLFEHALHNQTHNDGGSRGHISVNRWHIADNVPFSRDFEADIEKYFGNNRPTLYAATVYWYLVPGPSGKDPYGPVPVAERTNYYVLPAAASRPATRPR